MSSRIKVKIRIKDLLLILVLVSFLPKESFIILIFFIISFLIFLCKFYKTYSFNIIQLSIIILFVSFLYSLIIQIFTGNYLVFIHLIIYILIYFYFYYFLFALSKDNNPIKYIKLLKVFNIFVWIQVIIILCKAPFNHFERGDWAYGTTIHAHAAGFFIIVLCTYLLYKFYKKKTFLNFIKLSIALFAMYLCDVNQFMFSWLVALGISIFLLSNKKKKLIAFFISIFLLIFTVYWFWTLFSWSVENIDNIRKIKGYKSAVIFYKENPYLLPFGAGLGMFSSRAAVALADESVLAKPGGKRLSINSNSPYLKKYLSYLYTPEYYQHLLKIGTTGTFYTPFSEVLSIISEYGLVGTVVFIFIWVYIFRFILRLKYIDKAITFVSLTLFITYTIVLFYDNWLARPNVFFPVLLYILTCIAYINSIKYKTIFYKYKVKYFTINFKTLA